MSSAASPTPTLAPAPKRPPDFAVLIAYELIAQYEKKRREVKRIGLKHPKLSAASRWVFVTIASFAWKRDNADKRYRCHPGISTGLHRITGLNRNRTIPRAIAELEKAGLLKVTRRIDAKTGRRTSHLYEIIESPEAYQAVVARSQAVKPEQPRRSRGGAFPAAVEELEAARQLQTDYAVFYPLQNSGAPYLPHAKDSEAALALVRAYPKPKYRGALLVAYANPEAFRDTPLPPAHQARKIAHAPEYLPLIDRQWRSKGQGPRDDE